MVDQDTKKEEALASKRKGKTSGSSGSETTSNIASGFTGLAIMLLIFVPMILNLFGVGQPELELVTSAMDVETDTWTLKGRVIYDGNFVNGANVWAIANDERGNRYATVATRSDTTGGFVIGGVPKRLGKDTTNETSVVSVHSKAQVKVGDIVKDLSGKDLLSLGRDSQTRIVDLPSLPMLSIPLAFAASIFLALFQPREGSFTVKVKHYVSIFLAFLFTVMMVAYISIGLGNVTRNTKGASEIISLGFASIYYGSYVKDVEPQWLLSMTSPITVSHTGLDRNDAVEKGFGAPLWVVLLSVFGASVYTIRLIIKNIREPMSTMGEKEIRENIQEIVAHQFYILFAPLGSIVVYQLLVVSGAAKEYVTVGLAVFAAGAALNSVLERARTSVQGLLTK